MIQTAQQLIEQFGNQAYHVAVRNIVVATNLNDQQGAELYAQLALELTEMGYHKFPENKNAALTRIGKGSDL